MKIINTKENKITLPLKRKIVPEDIEINFEGGSGGGTSKLKAYLDETKSASYLFKYAKDIIVNTTLQYNDTENVENFSYMFNYSEIITSPSFNTQNGTNFHGIFSSCSKITEISITIPETTTTLNYFCAGCKELTKVNIVGTKNVTYWGNSFSDCKKLTSIPDLDYSSAIHCYSMFYSCVGIVNDVYFPLPLIGNDSTSIFEGCTNIPKFVITSSPANIAQKTFYNCTNCLEYDFTNCTAIPNLNSVNAFTGINANAVIKVPKALETEWKSATNWSTYADKIVGV